LKGRGAIASGAFGGAIGGAIGGWWALGGVLGGGWWALGGYKMQKLDLK